MPRDELRKPLRRRSLPERLWAKRPGAFMLTALTLALCFAAGGHLAAQDAPALRG